MSKPNISTELLHTFVTVVESDGFNRAARRLFKTQSTVSQQIKRLEDELSTSLFEADGRKRKLTAAGECFLGYATRLMSMQDEAIAAISETALKGELRIGVAQGLSEGPFPQIIARFARAFPNVRLNVTTGCTCDLNNDFDRGEYDFVLTVRHSSRGPGKVLGKAEMQWITPEGFRWDEVKALPLATFSPPCIFRELSLEALNAAGIPWRVIYTTTSLPGLMAAVHGGLAVTARTANALVAGTQVADEAYKLPKLPAVDVVLRHAQHTRAGELLEEMFLAEPPLAS